MKYISYKNRGIIMSKDIKNMREYRQKMNDLILNSNNKNIKRFFTLDSRAYDPGALDKKTKELMGLVASTVLRCNDCIFYHLDQCHKQEVTDEELYEAINIALIVGGSITVPHIRFIFDMWNQLKES
jgi:AhpD family alkylhydroperoxidase